MIKIKKPAQTILNSICFTPIYRYQTNFDISVWEHVTTQGIMDPVLVSNDILGKIKKIERVENSLINGLYPFESLDQREYPVIPDISSKGWKTLPKEINWKIFLPILKTSLDPHLQGVRFTENCLVVTDTRRLLKEEINYQFSDNQTIPMETIKILAKESPTEILQERDFCWFRNSSYTLRTRLIEGRFPDCNRIIPKDHKFKFSIDRKQFIQAIETLIPITSAKKNMLEIVVDFQKIILQEKVTILVENQAEWATAINFNSAYLLDFLKNVPDEKIIVQLTTNSYPGRFAAGNIIYVQMSMTEG